MSGATPIQLNAEALRLLSAAEIARAKREGNCADLLAGRQVPGNPANLAAAFRAGGSADQAALDRTADAVSSEHATPDPVVQLSAADLAGMSAADIVAAKESGALDTLLGRQTP